MDGWMDACDGSLGERWGVAVVSLALAGVCAVSGLPLGRARGKGRKEGGEGGREGVVVCVCGPASSAATNEQKKTK